ncbi:MAG: peptidylprolyl isomerase [Candidatus Omnitrophota bacterium]
MKRRDILRVVTFLSILVLCFSAYAGVVDKVIVVVNDEVITQREFDRAFEQMKQTYETNFEGDELNRRLEEAKKMLLEELINAKLVVSLAKEAKVEIDEEKLKERIESIKSYYASEDEFLRALSAKGTNLTEFEKELREHMLGQKLIQKEVASKIIITPSDIQELYEKNKEQMVIPKRVKVRGIMVRKNAQDDGTSQKKIQEVAKDLQKGRKFEKLAKEQSEGPYADSGGDMGYITPGQMLPEIDEVLFSLKKGESSEIIETHIGYHIFKVEDAEESKIAEFAEVSEFLREQLFMKRFQDSLNEWIIEKRENAYISYK